MKINLSEIDGIEKKGLLDIELSFSKPYGDKQKQGFYRELVTMISAGLTLKEAIELLSNEEKDKKRKTILKTLCEDLQMGLSLHAAFKNAKVFSEYEQVTIQMGEESGNLKTVIAQLSEFYMRKINQKRAFISALTYPAVILLTSVLAVGFMMLYMVPMFKDVFQRTGKDLPAITEAVISISVFLENNMSWFVLLVLIIVTSLYVAKDNAHLKKAKSYVLRKIPVFGTFHKQNTVMQWTSAMALMLESGVTLVKSLGLSSKLIDDFLFKKSLLEIEDALMDGQFLNQALQNEQMFDSKLKLMVKVAEEAHTLDVMFKDLSKLYQEDLEYKSKTIGTLLEPFIILFLGGIVGFILLAMYLPIFQMGSGV